MARPKGSRGGRGSGSALVVEGLDELIRACARVDKKIAGEIRREERRVGTIVTRRQREAAEARGLVGKTKKLSRGNRAAVIGSTLVVRNRVENDGYPYPLKYEFEGRAGEMAGPRAFFYRPAEDAMPEVVQGFDEMLDRLTASEGFAPGGRIG